MSLSVSHMMSLILTFQALPVDTRGIGNRDPEKPAENNDSADRAFVTGFPLDFSEKDLDVMLSVCGRIKRIKMYKDELGHNK